MDAMSRDQSSDGKRKSCNKKFDQKKRRLHGEEYVTSRNVMVPAKTLNDVSNVQNFDILCLALFVSGGLQVLFPM